MQVEWQTIEAIAKTKAIDLWLLFPLGIGVSRLLTRSGEIPLGWRTRLDKLLGTTNWYDEFYRVEHKPDLFGNDEERVVKATNKTIARYFNDRLKTIFPANGVADPGVLRNSVANSTGNLQRDAGDDAVGAARARATRTALLARDALIALPLRWPKRSDLSRKCERPRIQRFGRGWSGRFSRIRTVPSKRGGRSSRRHFPRGDFRRLSIGVLVEDARTSVDSLPGSHGNPRKP